MTARRAAWGLGVLAFLIYAATAAPGVTFWDSGEFIAAGRSLGIPHPPGTPLFVIALNVWARLLGALPFAFAANLFSAACTAAAVGATVWWLSREHGAPLWFALAAAATAGSMSSVWQNATETEVYAASLTLAVLAIVAADAAGRTGDRRWVVLAAYLLALAVPLHLSALVASPVVIYLATARADGTRDWSAGTALLATTAITAGVARLSPILVGIGVLVLVGASLRAVENAAKLRARDAALVALAIVAAMSALLFLLLRARHDPRINQANPRTWDQLAYVIGRRQYDVQGIYPREIPLWLQIANWFEYADWQFALSLGPTVIPTVTRVLATVFFGALAIYGSHWQWRADRRRWGAVALLFLCGSLGVIVYLNLRAGRSFAWNFFPDDAHHEARDRDYFFVLGFWAWGIWAGLGAMRVAERFAWPRGIGLAIAALPVALNWGPMNRRAEPEASMPREVARELLGQSPANAVLFVAGDNDTYPLWYAQTVERFRPDVLVVTMPLLAAPWYTDEIRRRAGLEFDRSGGDVMGIATDIAVAARQAGRPVAAALTVAYEHRRRLLVHPTIVGLVAIDDGVAAVALPAADSSRARLDTAAVSRVARSIAAWQRGAQAHPATDPIHEYFQGVLSCPGLMLVKSPTKAQFASLDSLCNLR
ncbi:MAG TPA: DUF2723 domain-containing protein [Gemmatimonadaceae bacterium]|nr:DUF2723 domain-containing protein [Gemmatimonadaceae bacterium]